MAWWPFGKKKPGDVEGEAQGESARSKAQGRPDMPLTDDPPGFDPGAPQLPAHDEEGAGGVTLQVPPPAGAQASRPPSDDPFAPEQPRDHFAQTMEDPDASEAVASAAPPSADPFAPIQPHDHFAQTIEDSDPGSVAAGLGADPFAPPHAAHASPGYSPGAMPASSEAMTLYAPAGSAEPFPGDSLYVPASAADPFQGTPEAFPGDTLYTPAPRDFSPAAPTMQLGPGAVADAYADPPDAHEVTTPLTFQGRPGAFAPPPAAGSPSPGFPTAPAPAPPPREPRPAPQPHTPPEENAMAANPTNASASLSADKRRLGLALLAGGPITHERLLLELDRSGKSGSVLGKALLQSNFAREDELLAVLVARVRIPKINVKNTKIPLDTIRLLPGDVARKTRTLPIEKIGDILVVVSPDIGDETALQAVRHSTGCLISPIQCAAEGFDEILEGYYDRLGASPATAPPSPDPSVAAHPPEPAHAATSAPSPAGVVAALPADEGQEDSWDRVYSNAGPIAADEALL